jgi:hypothetical protein
MPSVPLVVLLENRQPYIRLVAHCAIRKITQLTPVTDANLSAIVGRLYRDLFMGSRDATLTMLTLYHNLQDNVDPIPPRVLPQTTWRCCCPHVVESEVSVSPISSLPSRISMFEDASKKWGGNFLNLTWTGIENIVTDGSSSIDVAIQQFCKLDTPTDRVVVEAAQMYLTRAREGGQNDVLLGSSGTGSCSCSDHGPVLSGNHSYSPSRLVPYGFSSGYTLCAWKVLLVYGTHKDRIENFYEMYQWLTPLCLRILPPPVRPGNPSGVRMSMGRHFLEVRYGACGISAMLIVKHQVLQVIAKVLSEVNYKPSTQTQHYIILIVSYGLESCANDREREVLLMPLVLSSPADTRRRRSSFRNYVGAAYGSSIASLHSLSPFGVFVTMLFSAENDECSCRSYITFEIARDILKVLSKLPLVWNLMNGAFLEDFDRYAEIFERLEILCSQMSGAEAFVLGNLVTQIVLVAKTTSCRYRLQGYVDCNVFFCLQSHACSTAGI